MGFSIAFFDSDLLDAIHEAGKGLEQGYSSSQLFQ